MKVRTRQMRLMDREDMRSRIGAVVSDAAARVALMGANDVQSDIGVTDWLVFHG